MFSAKKEKEIQKEDLEYYPLLAVISKTPVDIRPEYYEQFNQTLKTDEMIISPDDGCRFWFCSALTRIHYLTQKITPTLYYINHFWENLGIPSMPPYYTEYFFLPCEKKQIKQCFSMPSRLFNNVDFSVLQYEPRIHTLIEVNSILTKWIIENDTRPPKKIT